VYVPEQVRQRRLGDGGEREPHGDDVEQGLHLWGCRGKKGGAGCSGEIHTHGKRQKMRCRCRNSKTNQPTTTRTTKQQQTKLSF
jgi:hypothetical protein